MKFPLSTLALLFLLCPPGDAADLFDAEDGMLDMSQYLAENRYGFLPVPLAITEPAIGYGGGLFGLFLHGKGSREGGQFIPPPLTAFGGAATQNGTWFIGGGHRHTWQHDRIRYLAGAGYANVNLDIYSGDTGGFSHAKPVQTQTKCVAALQKLLFRLGDTPVFLGASQVYARADVSTDNPRLNRVWQQVLGQNSTSSALGVVAEYDTTDNIFYPQSGLALKGTIGFSVRCSGAIITTTLFRWTERCLFRSARR